MRMLTRIVLVTLAPLLMVACAGGGDGSDEFPTAVEAGAESSPAVAQVDERLPAASTDRPSIEVASEDSGSELQDVQEAFIPIGTVVDNQGAVEVAVTLVESEWKENGKLIFQVVMNTHSVDLSMDLALLADLRSDNGLSLRAESWSGGSGHHVVGYLDFGVPDQETVLAMEEARGWNLSLREIDAPERVFAWYLGAAE